MKKEIFLQGFALMIFIAALICLSAFSSSAQKKHGGAEYKNLIKVNPIGMAFGQYQLAYERVLDKKTSVQLSVGYITLPSSYAYVVGTYITSYESVTSGVILIPEYRLYFKDAGQGLYAAGVARIRLVNDKLKDTSNPMNLDVSKFPKTFAAADSNSEMKLITPDNSEEFIT